MINGFPVFSLFTHKILPPFTIFAIALGPQQSLHDNTHDATFEM